jgi:hypothetical protein
MLSTTFRNKLGTVEILSDNGIQVLFANAIIEFLSY